MVKQTKTQSFNADKNTLAILDAVKKYQIKKDVFIKEALRKYFNSEILPLQLSVTKQGKYKDVPF